MIIWNFPEIDPKRSFDLVHYLNKIDEEVGEFLRELDPIERAKEALDVLHAAETFLRKFSELNPEIDLYELKDRIIAKNCDRGYYTP